MVSDIDIKNHSRFYQNEITPELAEYALKFAENYSGSFPFMLDMKKKATTGQHFSNAVYAAILNCAKKELNEKAASEPVTLDPTQPVGVMDEAEQELQEIIKTEVQKDALSQVFEKEAVDKLWGTEDFTEEFVEQTVHPSNPEHLAELSRLAKEMNKLQSFIDSAKASAKHYVVQSNKIKSEEQELFEAFQKAVEKKRAERADIDSAIKEAEIQAQTLEEQLKNTRNLYNVTLQQIAAEQKFDKIKKQLDELAQDQPWFEKVMPFQKDDIYFMAAAFLAGKNGVLNANDMGLGKTFESGALESLLIPIFVNAHNRHPRVLWLTKKSLRKSSWNELNKWFPDRQRIILDGLAEIRDFQVDLAIGSNSMLIANYDQLNTTPKLKEIEWDFIFMDEVHKVKGGANSKPTQIFVNTKEVCKKAKFVIPMSGSPIQNHYKEMWCYLNIFDEHKFPSAYKFEREYAGSQWNEELGEYVTQVNFDRIIKVMSDRVIRHSKEEVFPDLPDKVREFRYVERNSEQDKIYQQIKDEFFLQLDDEKAITMTAIIAQLTRLRQCNLIPSAIDPKLPTDSAKLDEALDLIEQLLAENHQIVVWSAQFNEPLFELGRRINKEFPGVKYEIGTGENSSSISETEKRFADGETRILLLNMKSHGEGLNLQTSSHSIFLDLWYNPEVNKQAEDRQHRAGQKNAVTVHIIQCEQSVDSFIAGILEEKEIMSQGIMESKELRKTGKEWRQYLMDIL